MTEEFWAFLSVALEVGRHDPLKAFCVSLRNGIPELGRAKVKVID